MRAERARAAAQALGATKAKINLPDLPAECRSDMPRAYPTLAEKPRNTQLRWEFIADGEDGKNARCAGFYDGVKQRYGGR